VLYLNDNMKIKSTLKKALKKSVFKRRAFFLISDILLIYAAMYISFWVRFNGEILVKYNKTIYYYIALAVVCKLFFFILYNLYDISWRFVGLNELIKVFKALSLSMLAMGMILYFLRLTAPFSASAFPRSILLIDYIISFAFIGLLRTAKRIVLEGFRSTLKPKKNIQKILIVGAGNAGEQIVREMKRNKKSTFIPIGFIDDDPAKKGIKIHGIRVLGNRQDIPAIIKSNEIDEVLIALPSSKSKDIREIAQRVRETDITEKIKILPSVTDLINGNVTLSDIKEIKLADLLGRVTINIDYKTIENFIKGKKVLITGAGGSIGSELARSALGFNPDMLIILDVDETEIFYLIDDLKTSNSKIIPVIGDIKDSIKMESVLNKYSPHIVLHAAAYKHVPILEFYPEEALKTNLLGTKVVAEAAVKCNVEKFIFISTDKAINPTSIMGATKRVCEEMIKVLDQKNSTKFISVRFGNVLGSRGSVIPRFRKQISKGGPVTVTHADMKRYFMITSEAVLLVLEAGAIGEGSEVFILDMGEQVKIIDLAKEMIALSTGKHKKDIPIIFSQIRPGEKLYEEITGAEEGVDSTKYDKLLVARDSHNKNPNVLMGKIDSLIKISNTENKKEEIVTILQEIVPTYKPYKDETLEILW